MNTHRSLYFHHAVPFLHNVPTMFTCSARSVSDGQGLYDWRTEHDACGVGFVVHIKGKPSHTIVRNALQVLINLEHRGACGCEANTGDGAGILIQTPDSFLRAVVPFSLPAPGSYAAGLVFLPHDDRDRDAIKSLVARIVEEEGQRLLGWREVPIDDRLVGPSARACWKSGSILIAPSRSEYWLCRWRWTKGRGATLPTPTRWSREASRRCRRPRG